MVVCFPPVCVSPTEHLCFCATGVVVWPRALKTEVLSCQSDRFLSQPATRKHLTHTLSCAHTHTHRYFTKQRAQTQNHFKSIEFGSKQEWLFSQLCTWHRCFMPEWVLCIGQADSKAQKGGRETQSSSEQDGVYWRGAMKVSCRWLMMLSAALSLRNWPKVIWVVSIESSICNEIKDPGSAKRRDPALMLQEWWCYCCTHMSCPCVWLSWLDFSGRGSNNSLINHIIVTDNVLVYALNSFNLI